MRLSKTLLDSEDVNSNSGTLVSLRQVIKIVIMQLENRATPQISFRIVTRLSRAEGPNKD